MRPPKAGISTSATPNAMPSAKQQAMTVRSAADPSAPARDGCGDGRTARTAGASANQSVPANANVAAASMAAQGATVDAIAATTSGPVMKNTSCTQASNA